VAAPIVALDEVRAALALSRRPGVGAKRFRALVERHGSARAALATAAPQLDLALDGRTQGPPLQEPDETERVARVGVPPGSFQGEPGVTSDRTRATTKGLPVPIEDCLAWLAARSNRSIRVYGSAGYPAALTALSEPPPVLFIEGALPAEPTPAIAVVGTREPTPGALAYTFALAQALSARGLGIVSGGARGVDAAAHHGALATGGAGGCATVAVFGCGPDTVYPPEHAGLYPHIVDAGGALVTELWPGTPPRGDFFVTRNRIIAGLSAGTVVVQANDRSGSRTTARHAHGLGRALFGPAFPARDGTDIAAILTGYGATPLTGDATRDAETIASIIFAS